MHGHVLVRIRRIIQIGGILVRSILSHNDSLMFLVFDCPSDAARTQVSVSQAPNERSFAIHAFSICFHFCSVNTLSRTSFTFESLDENQSNRELRSTHIELILLVLSLVPLEFSTSNEVSLLCLFEYQLCL